MLEMSDLIHVTYIKSSSHLSQRVTRYVLFAPVLTTCRRPVMVTLHDEEMFTMTPDISA